MERLLYGWLHLVTRIKSKIHQKSYRRLRGTKLQKVAQSKASCPKRKRSLAERKRVLQRCLRWKTAIQWLDRGHQGRNRYIGKNLRWRTESDLISIRSFGGRRDGTRKNKARIKPRQRRCLLSTTEQQKKLSPWKRQSRKQKVTSQKTKYQLHQQAASLNIYPGR